MNEKTTSTPSVDSGVSRDEEAMNIREIISTHFEDLNGVDDPMYDAARLVGGLHEHGYKIVSLNALPVADARNEGLEEALRAIKETALGWMPIHKDIEDLKRKAIESDNSCFTRLVAILWTADRALKSQAEGGK